MKVRKSSPSFKGTGRPRERYTLKHKPVCKPPRERFLRTQKSTEDEYLRTEDNYGGLLRRGGPIVKLQCVRKDEKGASSLCLDPKNKAQALLEAGIPNHLASVTSPSPFRNLRSFLDLVCTVNPPYIFRVSI